MATASQSTRECPERQAGMDAMRAREDALRGEVSAGEQYLDDLVAGNDELEAQGCAPCGRARMEPSGTRWCSTFGDPGTQDVSVHAPGLLSSVSFDEVLQTRMTTADAGK